MWAKFAHTASDIQVVLGSRIIRRLHTTTIWQTKRGTGKLQRIWDTHITMEEHDIPFVGADIYMRMADCYYEGIGTERNVINALRFYSMAECLFYYRLIDGDFYQKRSLERVIKMEEKIRKEKKEEIIPDLSWAGYGE